MKLMNTARKFGAKVTLGATGLMGLVVSAQAAVPAAVTSAIDGMKDDGVTVATAFLTATMAVYAIKFISRARG